MGVVDAIIEIFFFFHKNGRSYFAMGFDFGMSFNVVTSFDFTMAGFDYGLIYGSLISLERDRFKLRRRGRKRETYCYQ